MEFFLLGFKGFFLFVFCLFGARVGYSKGIFRAGKSLYMGLFVQAKELVAWKTGQLIMGSSHI